MKAVDISYYGNCDEDDGVILPQEAAAEEIGKSVLYVNLNVQPYRRYVLAIHFFHCFA